jgi:NhaC family Na+:H+ antiporter
MILFIVLGLSVDINGDVNIEALLTDIEASFTISLLFAVPVIVIGLIIRKTEPLIALLFGTLLAGILQYYFNPTSSIKLLGGANDFQSAYKGYGRHNRKSSHPTDNETLAALLLQECKNARHNLIICAMVLVV